MIYKPAGRRYYAVKFMWKGKLIRKSTGTTNRKLAKSIEGKIRAELAAGNWGILEPTPAPTLAEFLKGSLLPYWESQLNDKPGTLQYYRDGTKRLQASDIASLRLTEITDQHARQFESRWSALSPSTINCALRTLRRALSLAAQWGTIERMPRIALARGERQRERVLNPAEAKAYLAACPQPWRDVATVMLGTGMRPGELYRLRWEHVLLNGHGGLIQVAQGKSKAARRLLPMVTEVYQALKARHDSQGSPAEGWVFPTGSVSGHMEESSAKKWHAKALTTLEDARKKKPDTLEVKPFEPYCLRHTALTWLAPNCDAFTLARIAGHSSITITQRYCHPQADAVEAAFQRMAESQIVVTDGGHHQKLLSQGAKAESAASVTATTC
jgi:integrase